VSEHRIMIVGMPSSGKSTFLAALRHVLLSAETETTLVLARLANDERHLNRLEDSWLACETVERTREASEGWVSLHVQDRTTGHQAELIVPDLRGEVFERPAAGGSLLREVFDSLIQTDGLLIFTNADRPDDLTMMSDVSDLFEDETDQGGEPERRPPASFQPDMIPEEPKLVEMLQTVNRRPYRKRLRRIAVVVSAWDVVSARDPQRLPLEWLTESRPMLNQFLRHNVDAWDAAVYGISAQGGELPRDQVRLQAIEKASERVRVVGNGAALHDVTAPIAWLMKGG
jgi:hypothetical protein